MELSSVYVGVEDMERALDFYRELFDVEPKQETERFSTFAFDTGDFGLYNAGYDGYDVEFGNNCVPNFEVDDVEAAYRRVEELAPEMVHEDVLEFGEYRTFHFLDTEGNEIEVFSIDSG
ncbi:VOC family protein [Haloarchaeobius sp. HRN-SO-5]|uniref:VOC family protein n=1 Tax=Haloarchaeobius sp. HRN-SO-5 TaxID=3446118 RepID=UPI003EB6B74D